jgi:acyl carrier protein
MNQEIFKKVKDIVVEQLEVDADKVTPQANFATDLNADSLDTVELVMALEEEFDIEIPDEAAEQILTVEAAVDYISKKKAEAPA